MQTKPKTLECSCMSCARPLRLWDKRPRWPKGRRLPWSYECPYCGRRTDKHATETRARLAWNHLARH